MNVRFIERITEDLCRQRIIVGNCVYYYLNNDNRVKAYCEETGVIIKVINKTGGPVDCIFLPFENYFQPTRCSQGAPKWYQHIDGNHWYYEDMYKHVLPKDSDYKNLATAMENYIKIFE